MYTKISQVYFCEVLMKNKQGYDKRWDNLRPAAQIGEEPLSRENLAVKLPPKIDAVVRALPNRSQWMRRVLVEAAERELLGGESDAK
jgi:hypothetical protein